ncbi:MAG TPA: phosphoribosyltransferase family protein [bacterium]|nr:phosphoribosyltransferase family protein [bacterium]
MITLDRLKNAFLDFLFPPFCAVCRKPGKWLCADCCEAVKPEKEWNCLVCNQATAPYAICSACQPTALLNGLFIASHFNSTMQKVIHAYKYKYVETIAPLLADLYCTLLATDEVFIKLTQVDTLLIPVPLHRKRLNWRGFNQSELLAREYAKRFPRWRIASGLERMHETKTQMELDRENRLKNMINAFSYTGGNLENKTVLLVDDVSTTGATLFSCAEALKPANPKEIWGLVLAHG